MTTCEDVRPLLPDHLLGSLTAQEEAEVRGHLRGCAACRRDLAALDEGLAFFGSTLERDAPAELSGRVQDVLAEEWAERGSPTPRPTRWVLGLSVAASIAVAIVAATFGFVQLGRANHARENAQRYETVLETLGGVGFRAGTFQPVGETPVDGSVVAYRSSHEQSFVLVFVRAPGLIGNGTLVATRQDGTTWIPGKIEFDRNGNAATWWVTDRDVRGIDSLMVRAPDGSALATAPMRDV